MHDTRKLKYQNSQEMSVKTALEEEEEEDA